ncbi:MAG TPA: PP2C family protein-serine/threonine phosphatase [Tepidisphaeraceae bacterium]|nr:PP2C family protein-serine/threonine phosphatase [Tepidisphaeraceae bacterium]
MSSKRRPWQEELAIIDRTMKAISDVTDPEELVHIYWEGIGELLPIRDYLSLSRRELRSPEYLITRGSRFTEHFNPWTQRALLPRFSGGLLAEIIYANKPVFIDDLPARLADDEPARFYLDGYASLIALPQYDGGESLNVTISLFKSGDELDRSIIPMLHWQSGLFGRGTTNLVLRNDLAKALATLDKELQVVGDIQRSLLPRALPEIPGCEVAAFYQTSARAGGDYYDFFPLHHGGWGVFIADVSGHGTPAAVLMAITHAIAHAHPGTHTPPIELLKYLNTHLTRSYTSGGTFVTAFYAVFDPASRSLTYSSAGHNPPQLVRGDRVISLDQNGALPLGIEQEQAYHQTTLTLQKGDLLLLYTDGITEAMAPSIGGAPRELFGVERLDRVLLDCGAASAEACVARIRNELLAFCAQLPQTDDQTLIAIRCLP